MLTHEQRLRKSADIKRVYTIGRKAFHPLVRCVVAPGLSAQSRAAVVVSLKVSKKAVDRNTIKRRLRPLLRRYLPMFKHTVDCVVIAQPRATQATTPELAQALAVVFSKLKLV